jgi:hypothetical protein
MKTRSPEAKWTRSSSFGLTPRLRSTFYPDDPEEEADDQFLKLDWEHTSERTRSTFLADYQRATTLGRYFPKPTVADDDVLGEPEPGQGVGRFDVRNREERIQAYPEIGFTLTERTSLDLGAKYLDVTYDQQELGDREDFSSIVGLAALRFRTSDTASLALRGRYLQYEPESGADKEAYGVDAEWANGLSETAQVFVRGGVTRTRVDATNGGASGEWEEGFSGGAGVRWDFEVTRIFVDVDRDLDPNPSGTIVTRDQLRAQWSRRLGPMTTITVATRFIADSGATDDDFVDREYAAATIGFDWRIARQWSLIGSYDYHWRDYDGSVSDAASNALSLGILYQPNRGNR